MSELEFLIDGPPEARATFLFAHGAGAPMDSPFMADVAKSLGDAGIRVLRFEFPYMAARRSGQRKGPDRPPILIETWHEAIASNTDAGRTYIGGKSLGGRIATMVADDAKVDGVVCFGYPFHPPGRPERLRTAHLKDISTPVLILQGERDPFGTAEDVAQYELSPMISVAWIPDGDHSLKPRKRSGHTHDGNLALAAQLAVEFIAK